MAFNVARPGAHRAPARPKRRLTAVAAIVAAVAGSWFVPTEASAATTVTALTFNMCGVVCRKGEVKNTAAYTAGRITGGNVTVGFLQEICYSQYKQIQDLVAKKGYTTVYASQTSSGTCDNVDRRYGTGFGTAIVVKGRTTGRTVVPLPVIGGAERRNLLGATATIGGRSTFVAVVHTSPGVKTGLDGQLPYLAKYLNAKASKPVIVGGDFNALPDNKGMAGLYSPSAGGTGKFIELDERRTGVSARSGVPTFSLAGRKIDYVFVSKAHFGSPKAVSTVNSMSDHYVYSGTVRTL